jgi:hypothetical protein
MTSTVVTKTTEVVTSTTTVELDSTDAAQLIARFTAAKAAMKVLEAEKETAEAAIRELLGDAEVGIIAGVERVRIAQRNRSNIDRKVLQNAFPEAYQASLYESPYTVLIAK